MSITNFEQLLEAGVHFGHLKRKWNPAMRPFIFMERNGIHIIDLNQTVVKTDEAAAALKQIAKSGKKILFVATKKQAKQIVADKATLVGMPYVIERWPGGMLTNFPTIRKAVKKMNTIDRMGKDGTFDNLSKREKLQVTRQRAKLEKNLGSIIDLTRLPAALFVVDVMKEHIAVSEANRLGIPVFAMVDTNSDPANIDFVIPANDDASKSIDVILGALCGAISEGLEERKIEKADSDAADASSEEDEDMHKSRKVRTRIRRDASDAESESDAVEETSIVVEDDSEEEVVPKEKTAKVVKKVKNVEEEAAKIAEAAKKAKEAPKKSAAPVKKASTKE
ncbi:MAG: 30S ribosomal protein S2 [Bacteroidales bacterium]